MSVRESRVSQHGIVFKKKKNVKRGENTEFNCSKFNANAETVSLLCKCFI